MRRFAYLCNLLVSAQWSATVEGLEPKASRLLERFLADLLRSLGALALLLVLPVAACSPAQNSSTAPMDRQAEQASAREFFGRVADCMTGHGFPAEVIDDGSRGGVEFASPPGQEAAAESAYGSCAEENGGEPTPAPPSDNEVEEIYQNLLEVRDCLEGEGYTTPDPPSLATFVEQYRRAGLDQEVTLWSPYPVPGGLVDVGALQACPGGE
ncbi:hypothetical protein [Ornithinimicrobium tianjinense]|uniref:Uncharacterized protein n=1 Tax=Ornithinimicrobium tianjinense TaxID=1195761 RepID=A0A917F895_9MICO|nr:hypothetical protein [Ornithinimicrobium tianjinense]GGF55024.1 hypothetical protein GCM10011366_23660 [Ornithinimicrobium tianjinense]